MYMIIKLHTNNISIFDSKRKEQQNAKSIKKAMCVFIENNYCPINFEKNKNKQ